MDMQAQLTDPVYVAGMPWEEAIAPQAREHVIQAVLTELQKRSPGKQVAESSLPVACLPSGGGYIVE